MKLLTIIAGALAGGVVSLTTTWWIGLWRRCRLHRRLLIYRPEAHPPKADIYADESQSLQILEFNQSANWIGIFSESRMSPYRVFLRADKVYEGRLKIVSKETKAKEVAIRINLRDSMFPQKTILI